VLRLITGALAAAVSLRSAPPADSTRRVETHAPARHRHTQHALPQQDSVWAARWALPAPAPLPGAILPKARIVAFYGNPLSKRMGVLGQYPVDTMLARLDREVSAWQAADSATPVIPALHLIAVVAQGAPGTDGKYRARMPASLIEQVYGWSVSHHALLFLDIQPGKSTVADELPRLEPFLRRPNVHLALDPEFAMHKDDVPGRKIGSLDADDVNTAIAFLAKIAATDSIPPKVLIVHRFTRPMLTRFDHIVLDPHVQVVVDMDGFGPPSLKRDSYHDYVFSAPVQYTGWKTFFRQDSPRMPIADILKLTPAPLYIQYQ
jgi:hypothetical protein